MTKHAIPLLLAIGLMVAGAITASAHRVEDCRSEITAAVADRGVERRSVRDIEIWHQDAAGSEGGRQGYLAYVGLATCDGTLTVSTAASCDILQVYTTGNCAVPGVPHFD